MPFTKKDLGDRAERHAQAWLKKQGLKTLASNYRCRLGEVDLVMLDGATLVLFAVSLLPFITEMSGWIYLAGAVVLGARFIYWSLMLMYDKREHAAIKTFKYSITYLMLLFVVLLADHYYRALGLA